MCVQLAYQVADDPPKSSMLNPLVLAQMRAYQLIRGDLPVPHDLLRRTGAKGATVAMQAMLAAPTAAEWKQHTAGTNAAVERFKVANAKRIAAEAEARSNGLQQRLAEAEESLRRAERVAEASLQERHLL